VSTQGKERKKMNITNPVVIGLLIIVGLVIGVFLARMMNRMQRTRKLQEKFGPEYEHTLDEVGDKREAERDLQARLDHVRQLDIRSLTQKEIDRFSEEWRVTQAQFVDEPLAAMQKADRLIREVMKTRGYPVEDFEQRVADISVNYPELVTNYRGLHALALKGTKEKIGTEEMRQAMIHGRALFENLVRQEEDVEDIEKEKMA
jgi:bacterioferritin (cytochrome b1)